MSSGPDETDELVEVLFSYGQVRVAGGCAVRDRLR